MEEGVMSKATTRKSLEAPADYIELAQRFPVRPLKTKADYDAALAILEPMVGRDDLTKGREMYLDALASFVEIYEARHHPVKRSKTTPAELLRELMEHRQMSVNDLGAVIGSQPMASMILNGKRGISRTNVKKLAEHFRVNPALFIDPQMADEDTPPGLVMLRLLDKPAPSGGNLLTKLSQRFDLTDAYVKRGGEKKTKRRK
jgi:HTH-type transcriptional regulator / antitoxin HigA